MPQNAPQPPAPPALFDPASVEARDYEPSAVAALALWLMLGTVLMFAGNPLMDTSGLGLTIAEASVLLILDRRGFYTGAGLFKVDEWSKTRRILLAIAEVPLYYFALALYVIRISMAKFTQLQSSAPGSGAGRR
jgi:hypothetical protein